MHVAGMEEGRSALKILTGEPNGKRLLGRPRRRWEDNIRMVLEEIGVIAGNWAGHVARMEEGRSAFKILTGQLTGKRSLGRPRRRWEDNIRMVLEEIGIIAGNWAGHVARMEEGRSAFQILTGNPIGKRPLGRPRRRWDDNIIMDLQCGELG